MFSFATGPSRYHVFRAGAGQTREKCNRQKNIHSRSHISRIPPFACDTNYHSKLLTVLTIDLHSGPWSICFGWPAQFIPPPQGSLRPTIGPSLAHKWRLSQGFTKAKWYSFLAAMYFSSSWWTTKMASVVPLPGTKLNCISSVFTISQMLKYSTHFISSMTWSVSFRPL